MGAHFLATEAKRHGPLPPGHFRVVVSQDGNTSHFDSDDRSAAEAYADDAAAEHSDAPTLAVVFDENWTLVHRGRPYFAK